MKRTVVDLSVSPFMCVKFYSIRALVSLTQSKAGGQPDSQTASIRYLRAKNFVRFVVGMSSSEIEVVDVYKQLRLRR